MRNSLRGALAAVALCLGLTLVGRAEMIKTGKTAPAWSGKSLAGKTVKSADFKGKVLLMNFFSYY